MKGTHKGNPFVFSDEFSHAIQQTDHYYVIVSREGLPNLPYSVTEIYGIRSSGEYGGLKQHYHEFYRIYGEDITSGEVHPDMVITEDSHSHFQFFQDVCRKCGASCQTANGKANILQTAREQSEEQEVLLVADGATTVTRPWRKLRKSSTPMRCTAIGQFCATVWRSIRRAQW